jgi:periplasmic copper chaperone A
MNGMSRGALLTILIALCACSRSSQPGVEIDHARSPAVPPGATVAAVYAELKATQADTLLRAETPIAEKVAMHSTAHENGMMQMRPAATVDVPAGATVEFAPGALHFMLIGLREPHTAQSTFPMTLHFERAGPVTVEVIVVAPGEMQH